MVLMTAFAALAVVLTATGIYGLLAYYVAQRKQEIGIRIALGAGRGSVLKLILGQGVAFVIVGAVAGLAGAFAATKLLASLTFGIGKYDPISFVSTVALLIAIALLAGYIPARRAMSVDPMIALRYD
jgi:putative ABC transport system permease protein